MSMSDHIDALLEQAAAYADKRLDDASFVDFKYEIPDDQLTSYDEIETGKHERVEMREEKRSGDVYCQRRMFAKCDMKEGTHCLVSQPVAVFWDVEDDASDTKQKAAGKIASMHASTPEQNDNHDSMKEGQLVLRALEKIEASPDIWQRTLSKLYPRDTQAASKLQPWICSDAAIRLEVEAKLARLSTLSLFDSKKDNQSVCNDIAHRLPLIIRYNAFIMETSSELFVYPQLKENGLESLSGVGLYGPELSYFNHSCTPNISRFCIGDVMFFVTNRPVSAGDELCHSYLSHEYLCEDLDTRRAILANEFNLESRDDADENKRHAKRQREEDSRPSDNIECVPPFVLGKRFDPETGMLYKAEGRGEDFKCYHNYLFCIWKARILEERGRSNKHRGDKKLGLEHALPEWEAAIEFAEATFPPLDARKVVLYVQAALCASVNAFDDYAKVALRTKGVRVGDAAKARFYADKAFEMHLSIFGGGKMRFLKRYVEEFLTSGSSKRQMRDSQLMWNLQVLWGFTDEMWEELTASQARGKELVK